MVTVFYSKADPQWTNAEKVITTVGKNCPRLQILKVAIDDLAGYQQLIEAEKNLKIQPTGDITLVMGSIFLTSQGERRDIEKQFGPMIEQLFSAGEKKGRLVADIGAYIGEFFGKDASMKAETKDSNLNIVYYQVIKDGRQVGWVVDVFREIHCPTCADAQFLVAIELPELKVLDVRPIRPLEKLTGKLDEEETAKFTKQFKNRTRKDPDQKVNIISGAANVSHAYESAMNEIMQTLR
ncbi:MAG: hypothetical protein V1899_05410 [Planctomycetota bacterium]